MPVVRHQRLHTDPRRRLVGRFPQDDFKRVVIRRLLGQLHAHNAAIQDVKDHPSRRDPRCSSHAHTTAISQFVDTGPVPLFSIPWAPFTLREDTAKDSGVAVVYSASTMRMHQASQRPTCSSPAH